MTSLSPPIIPPQVPNNTSQAVPSAHSPSASTSGRAPSQAAGTASAKTSYASATKKPFSPPPASSSSTASIVAPNDAKSPVNGRIAIPPAVPTVGSPTIVNGNTPTSSTSGPGEHSRNPAVNVSAVSASGHLPNGGSVAGKSSTGNGIRFGSMNADGTPAAASASPQPSHASSSLSVNQPTNPRATSPAASPSPIPQPSASGGKPPSTLHGHSNSVSFGNFGGPEGNQMRPGSIPQGPLAPGPQANHLRRESSQSQHSDMSSHGVGPAGGRGGYPAQGGRGRNYGGPPYPQQMPYSPGPNYRQPPNQPRGNGPNMSQYPPQNRQYQQYPNSPHQAARSPAPPNAQPVHQQPGPMPMQSPHMGQQQYGGYPTQPYGYPPNMGPPQVKPSFSSTGNHKSPRKNFSPRKSQKQLREEPTSYPPLPILQRPLDLSPHSGNFEHYLTARQQGFGMPQHLEPNYAAQYYHIYGQYPVPNMMPPQSPRPPNQLPPGPQGTPFQGQYGSQQPPAMSRTSSAISGTDRPASSMGKPPTTSTTPASTNTATSRQTNTPAPKASNNFQIPKKSAALVIKNPNSGEVVDLKQSSSPAPSNKSPANASAAPTPPPRAPSQNEASHARNESKTLKTDEEKRAEMKEQFAKNLAEDQRKKEEEKLKTAQDKKDAEAKLQKDTEEADAKQQEAAKAQMDAEEAAKKNKAEAEEAEKAASKAKVDEDAVAEKARKDKELDDMIAEMEAKEAERERKEAEAEKAYQAKKKAEKDEAARKEAEAFKMADEEMKRAEREAEEAEEARLKEQQQHEGDDSQKEKADAFADLTKDNPVTPLVDTPTTEQTPADSGAATPASDAPATITPKSTTTGGKQKPTALKLETHKPVEPAQPTAALMSLRSARRLTSINDVSYPAQIHSPNPALNTAAPMGKFKYDREFLLQFQNAFTDKPSENWIDKVKETVGDGGEPSSARGTPRASNSAGGSMMSGRQPSNRAPLPQMGAFAQGGRTLPPGTSSQQRFEAASRQQPAATRPTMQNPLAGFVSRPGAFPQPATSIKMDRTPSTNSINHPNSPRNASQRGGSHRGSRQPGRREDPKDNKAMPLTAGASLKPIEVSATGWKPRSVGANATGMAGPAPGGDGLMAPDVVQRKVKAALNKMTPEKFDKISSQILAIAGQSKVESDGRSLRQVIQLTFEKATDEAHWAEMYAQFCKRMLESMSTDIKDENILDKKGDVVVGGALFRKYLLTRCQTEFERGWKMNLPEKPEGETEEAAMLSDAYYIAAAAKRRGLGLVRFIGELYKLQMLTERIMHECVKKLVDYEGVPDEAEVESLTSLLRTIGQQLDASEKGRSMMDAYFDRIRGMIDLPDLPSRLRFMLMDIVDLRTKLHWHTKGNAVKGPTTLEAVRQQTIEVERQKDVQRAQDNSRRGGGGGGRPPIGRGDARNFSGGGGPQYGMMQPPDFNKNTVGMDDLRRLGSKGGSRQVSTQGPTFGPPSMFSSARGSNTRKPLSMAQKDDSGASSRVSTPPGQKDKKDKEEAAKSASNTFSALASLESSEPAENASPANSPPTAKSQPAERQRARSPPNKDPPGSGPSAKEGETS